MCDGSKIMSSCMFKILNIKSHHLLPSLNGNEQGVAIVEKTILKCNWIIPYILSTNTTCTHSLSEVN